MIYLKIYYNNRIQIYKCNGKGYWFRDIQSNNWTKGVGDCNTIKSLKSALIKNDVKHEAITKDDAFLEMI